MNLYLYTFLCVVLWFLYALYRFFWTFFCVDPTWPTFVKHPNNALTLFDTRTFYATLQSKYKWYRHSLTHIKRKNEIMPFKNFWNQFKSNSGKFRRIVKENQSKLQETTTTSMVKLTFKVHLSTARSAANALNNYFANVGPNLRTTIARSTSASDPLAEMSTLCSYCTWRHFFLKLKDLTHQCPMTLLTFQSYWKSWVSNGNIATTSDLSAVSMRWEK